MADVFTKAKRSSVMVRIRSRGNRATELRLIALFHRHGIKGWRRHPCAFGNPDFSFPREKIAIFVDGCFWHRHPGCKLAYMPKTRAAFWSQKFESNIKRDTIVNRTLRKKGWRVFRVWECELHERFWPSLAKRIVRLRANLRSRSRS